MLAYLIYFLLWPFFAFIPRFRFLWKYYVKGNSNALERLGRASIPRPKGSLACFYASSLGEVMSIIPFVQEFHKRFPHYNVLLLTHTATSAHLVKERLPWVLHQYAPWDSIMWSYRFLRYWKPQVWFQVEADLFPNFLISVSRLIPLKIYINARMSPSAFRTWRLFPPLFSLFSLMLKSFHHIYAQTIDDQRRIQHFTSTPVQYFGNLKHAHDLTPNRTLLDMLRSQCTNRPVLVYSSTHSGEEAIAMAIHRTLHAQFPQLLTIIIPRYPHRVSTLMKDFSASYPDLRLRVYQVGQTIPANIDVCFVQTIGFLNLFYALADVVFVGRSLSSVKKGGQNIWEPAYMGKPVLFGPHTDSFRSLANQMVLHGGAQRVYDADDLQAAISSLLHDTGKRSTMGSKAYDFAHGQPNPIGSILDSLTADIDRQDV